MLALLSLARLGSAIRALAFLLCCAVVDYYGSTIARAVWFASWHYNASNVTRQKSQKVFIYTG
ncbi:hypothetical protein FOMA001_g11255 [Fusarium oxysporum f. sp. matthiolae]|nr:hypothetical protein FOMA001_g11255 [Fusarium oxysporum f. sp. matthiolae]